MGDFNPASTLIGTTFEAAIDPATQQPDTPVNFGYRINLPSGGYVDRTLAVPLSDDQKAILYNFFQQCIQAAQALEGLTPGG